MHLPQRKFHGISARNEASWSQRAGWKLNNLAAGLFEAGEMALKGIAIGVAVIAALVGVLVLGVIVGTAVILVAWNLCDVHSLFKAPAVTFWQAVGLALLLSMLLARVQSARR